MPINKGLLALGALGALGALFFASDSKASTNPNGGGGGTNPNDPDLPAGCEFDANLPASLKAAYVDLMHQATGHYALVENLKQAALQAEHSGYPKVAACLNAKAAEVKNQAQAEIIARGGMPFTIRTGDIPSHLAAYYTGQQSRFHELEPLNPQIGHIVTVGGVSNYQHWEPGMLILIPASWNPLDKPLPQPLSGGGTPPPSDQKPDGHGGAEPILVWPDDFTPVNPIPPVEP
jgi:hypothetical protein